MRDVRFHRLATKEYVRARRWYAKASAQAAVNFAIEVGNAIDRIMVNAELCSPGIAGMRWVRVKRFDYVLHFRIVDEDIARILAISHTSRRPGYWLGRLLRS
jgi:hypothetical protein